MEAGRLLAALIFITVPIVAIIVFISISWQLFPKECRTALAGSRFSVLSSLKTCVDNCWSKHGFGSGVYSDDCYIISINSTSSLDKGTVEEFLNKPANTKVYFEFLEENIEHRVKIRYNSSGKEISIVLLEA